MREMTCTLPSDEPTPTLDDMLASIDAALAIPQPIGMVLGEVVYLHHDTRELSFRETRCSIEHPFLAGTKIRAAALAALGEL